MQSSSSLFSSCSLEGGRSSVDFNRRGSCFVSLDSTESGGLLDITSAPGPVPDRLLEGPKAVLEPYGRGTSEPWRSVFWDPSVQGVFDSRAFLENCNRTSIEDRIRWKSTYVWLYLTSGAHVCPFGAHRYALERLSHRGYDPIMFTHLLRDLFHSLAEFCGQESLAKKPGRDIAQLETSASTCMQHTGSIDDIVDDDLK